MKFSRITQASFLAIVCAGCGATNQHATSQPSTAAKLSATDLQPATRPIVDPKASLTLDEIEPHPQLMTPTTRTSGEAPIDALVLFARACDALATDQRFTAVNLLEKASRLDPASLAIYKMLARAELAASNPDKAIEALNRAAELSPDDLATQVSLGRLYLNRKDSVAATAHLRLALQTRGYSENERDAITADYLLARALQAQSYDRAAIDQYKRLLDRLAQSPSPSRAGSSANEVAIRPEAVIADVARLSEKQGNWNDALEAWQTLSREDADNFEPVEHVVQMNINLGNSTEALHTATDAVRHFAASPQSMNLLRDTAKKIGRSDAELDALSQLHAEIPKDRAVTFALANLYSDSHQDDRAEKLLQGAVNDSGSEIELVRQLFRYYADHGKAQAAGTLIIEAAARNPDDSGLHLLLFTHLLDGQSPVMIRVSDMTGWNVSPAAQGAKDFFIATAAVADRRPSVSREAITKGVQTDPFYASNFRLALANLLDPSVPNNAQAAPNIESLIATATRRGPAGFGDELRGLWLLSKSREDTSGANTAAAGVAFKAALAAATPPDVALLLEYAEYQQFTSNSAKAEQIAWKIISDHPTNEQAYALLFRTAASDHRGQLPAMMNVLQRWLAADPMSDSARLIEADILAQNSEAERAEQLCAEIIRDNPYNAAASATGLSIARNGPRAQQFLNLLNDLHARQPKNLVLVQTLIASDLLKPEEVTRLIDDTRMACAADPRLLYTVASMYATHGALETSQDVLKDILKVAPNDPGANNDVGYEWADAGTHLDEAEAMIRKAVAAEPDNSSYIDSLGWVLYKRGKFTDARPYLERAANESGSDPIVLNHLGDTLYRIGDSTAAKTRWIDSLKRIKLVTPTAEATATTTIVETKLRELANGQPASVAPIVTSK